jgi:hypothetical protein
MCHRLSRFIQIICWCPNISVYIAVTICRASVILKVDVELYIGQLPRSTSHSSWRWLTAIFTRMLEQQNSFGIWRCQIKDHWVGQGADGGKGERRYLNENQERVGTGTRTHIGGYRRMEEAISQINHHGKNFHTVHIIVIIIIIAILIWKL